MLLHPLRSELNFPIGEKFPLAPVPARCELPPPPNPARPPARPHARSPRSSPSLLKPSCSSCSQYDEQEGTTSQS
jgi:hypothetical protein